MNLFNELRYTKEHEWIRIEKGIATIGIADFAQAELGDIVLIPAKGYNIIRGL